MSDKKQAFALAVRIARERKERLLCVACKRKQPAIFVAPANLCTKHWRDWWDYKIVIKDRKVLRRLKTKSKP